MNRNTLKSYIATAVLAMALTTTTAAQAGDSGSSSDWQHRVLIYGWLPSLSGTLNYDIPGSGGSAGADANDLIDNLKMVFMGAYEGRKDKWSLKADVIYLDLGSSDYDSVSLPVGPGQGQIQMGAEQSMTGWVLGFYGGYNTIQTETTTLDVMAGLRYLDIEADAALDISGPLPPTLPGPTLSRSVGLWDGVVGVKGHFNINENWFVPYHLDIGAGDSDLTWQALAGVGYRFKWGDTLLAYRHLYYDEGDAGLIQDLEFSGPALGVNFHF